MDNNIRQLNKQEFENKELFLNSYPKNIYVEITRNCNLKCSMCKNRKRNYDSKFNMDFDFFKKIADELFPHAEHIDLRGFGESMIHPEFEKFLDYTLKYDAYTGLVTNLAVKNDHLWKKMVRKGCWIAMSIDSAYKKKFESIRKGSNFKIIKHNLKLITDTRNKYDTDVWKTYFIITLQKQNVKELKDILVLAHDHGIKRVEVNPVRLPVWDKNHLRWSSDKDRHILDAEEYAKKKGMSLLFHGDISPVKNNKASGRIVRPKRCPNPWTNLFITYDGKIGPCNHLMSKPVVLGDLKKGSFREEWNNEKFQRFRKYNDTILRYRPCNWCYRNKYS